MTKHITTGFAVLMAFMLLLSFAMVLAPKKFRIWAGPGYEGPMNINND